MRFDLRWLMLLLGVSMATTLGCGSFTGVDDSDVRPYNTPPTVIIRSPSEAQSVEQGETVKFQASVSDTEDFESDLRVEWSSSIDGKIFSTIDTPSDTCPDVGGMCEFYLDSLSVGEHVLTVRVLDQNGFSGADSVNLTVTEPAVAPTCQILSPTQDAHFVEGEAVSFTGQVSDANGDLVTVQSIWASDLDGTLETLYPDPNGNIGYTANDLSVGRHTITLLVQDETELSSFCSLYINIDPANLAPTVDFTNPTDGYTLVEGDALRLEGVVSDDRDAPETLWLTFISDIDGPIFEGRSDDAGNVAFTTSELGVGDHTLRLAATDSGGLTAEDSVLVKVQAENQPPTVEITGAEPEGDVIVGTAVTFHATVADGEDGPLPLDVLWTSSLQGVLTGGGTPGADGSVSLLTTALMPGVHTITLVVRDTQGLPASASTQITVRDENAQPEALITGPGNGTYLLGDTLLFEGIARDAEDAASELLVIWTSDLESEPLESTAPDDAGNISFLYDGLSVGNHLITLTVIDTEGKTATATNLISIRPPNQAPTITFTGPENRTYSLGDTVIFSAEVADSEDSPDQLDVIFESDRNGRLCESLVPPSDGKILCSVSSLIEGTHLITARVSDRDGSSAVDDMLINIEVENRAPVIAGIEAPADYSEFIVGTPVVFRAQVSDAEDLEADLLVRWTSNLDGEFNTAPPADGGSMNFTFDGLSVGEHTITLEVQDSEGAYDQASVFVYVRGENTAPSAEILQPTEGLSAEVGTALSFVGLVGDSEDSVNALSIRWTSDIDGELSTNPAAAETGLTQFTTASLTPGVHTISLRVQDSGQPGEALGLVAVDEITVQVREANTGPLVTITSPENGHATSTGTTLTFEGQATDDNTPAGELAALWSSDLDGVLFEGNVGVGGQSAFTFEGLSVGIHLITLQVTDADGASGTDSITLTVSAPNTAPEILSLEASELTVFEGTFLTFSALVNDVEDLPQDLILDWTSSIDLGLGQSQADADGNALFVTNTLSVGDHLITLTVTDTDGRVSSDNIQISVRAENEPPSAAITAPENGEIFFVGEAIVFEGLVEDDVDAADDLAIRWSSSQIEAPLSEAPADSRGVTTFSTAELDEGVFLDEGIHTIYLDVTDLDGQTSRAQITLEIRPENNRPEVVIESPEDGGFEEGQLVEFEAMASDVEDAADSLTYRFISDRLDGETLASGNVNASGEIRFSTADLPIGVHIITLEVTDLDGGVGRDDVSIAIYADNIPPVVEILEPESGGTYSSLDTVLIEAMASDEDGVIGDATYTLTSNLEADDLATGQPVSNGAISISLDLSTLSEGTHSLTLTVTDTVLAQAQDSVSLTVVVPNQAPELTVVSPELTSFSNEDTVTFTAEVSDSDDAPDELNVSWISDSDGILFAGNADGNGISTFDTDGLSVGTHVITVTVTDSEGLTSDQTLTIYIVEGNEAPGQPEISIEPTFPKTANDLRVSIVTGATDPDGDTVSYKYQWYRAENDGEESQLLEGFTAALIPYQYTSKAEVWTVRVTATDGVLDGPYAEASVTIFNTAPTVSGVLLSPTEANVESVLSVSYSFDDVDGDVGDDSQIRWFVNGSLLASENDEPSLNGDHFAKGDVVTAQVIPFDGEDSGVPGTSNSVTISNSIPSQPVVGVSPALPNIDDALTCAVLSASVDADGDVVSYTYEWYVDGRLAFERGPKTSATDILSAQETAFGEDWTCRVIPGDGSVEGDEASDGVLVLPEAGDLVITELMIQPGAVSDGLGEYIEVYNPTGHNIPLDGFTLADGSVDAHIISSAGSLVVPGGGRRVLGIESSDDLNGGVPVDYEYNNLALTNNGDTVILKYGDTIVDEVSYSLAQVELGRSLTLDPDASTAVANNNAANWCLASSSLAGLGGDIGSPGASNEDCSCSASDGDGDGFGDALACTVDDCDDGDAAIHPYALDVCEDGVDADCQGGDTTCACEDTDLDGDGFGTAASCGNQDCDDDNPFISPAASELCDEIDNDCDSTIDEDFDNDGDGNLICVVDGIPADCDDNDDTRSFLETESCDAVDNDCDAAIDETFDFDEDGNPNNPSGVCTDKDGDVIEEDCADNDPDQYVGNTEICDGVDNNCDSTVNEGWGDFYETLDGDADNNQQSRAIEFVGVDDSSVNILATIHSPDDTADYYYVELVDDNPISDNFSPFRVTVTLTQPSGVNYHLTLFKEGGMTQSDTGSDTIKEVVISATNQDDGGRYYIVVEPDQVTDFSCVQSYRLEITNSG